MAAYSLSPGDIIEATDFALYQGQVILATAHFVITTAAVADGPAGLAVLLAQMEGATGIFGRMRKVQLNTVTTQLSQVQKVWPTRWAPVSDALLINGQQAGTDSPVNSAVSIERKPLESGKGFAGRLQLCGWDFTGFSGGRFTPPVGQVAAYNNLVDALKTDVALGGGSIASPYLVNLRKTPPTTRKVVVTQLAPNPVRTMHRRTVGLGI